MHTEDLVSKDGLLSIIERLLDARDGLDFLMQLERDDLERLVVAIRATIGGDDRSS